jgi:hypothetical protein
MTIARLRAIVVMCLLFAAPAHAKKGIMLFNTGDELFSIAPFQLILSKTVPLLKTTRQVTNVATLVCSGPTCVLGIASWWR